MINSHRTKEEHHTEDCEECVVRLRCDQRVDLVERVVRGSSGSLVCVCVSSGEFVFIDERGGPCRF